MLILYTLAYTVNHFYLPFLIKSTNGTDSRLLIIGDISIPLWLQPIPSNFRYIRCSWNELITRTETFLGVPLASLHNSSNMLKSNDFKPLIPALFPDLFPVSHSNWIGWVDNDVWVSNTLIQNILQTSDINFIQFIGNKKEKNTMVSNIFRRKVNRDFAGWGMSSRGGLGYEHSFSYILEQAFRHPSFHSLSIESLFTTSYKPFLLDQICISTTRKRITSSIVTKTTTSTTVHNQCGYSSKDNYNNHKNNNQKGKTRDRTVATVNSAVRTKSSDGDTDWSAIWNSPDIVSTYANGISISNTP
eukprot:gene2561-5002_t